MSYTQCLWKMSECQSRAELSLSLAEQVNQLTGVKQNTRLQRLTELEPALTG